MEYPWPDCRIQGRSTDAPREDRCQGSPRFPGRNDQPEHQEPDQARTEIGHRGGRESWEDSEPSGEATANSGVAERQPGRSSDSGSFSGLCKALAMKHERMSPTDEVMFDLPGC